MYTTRSESSFVNVYPISGWYTSYFSSLATAITILTHAAAGVGAFERSPYPLFDEPLGDKPSLRVVISLPCQTWRTAPT